MLIRFVLSSHNFSVSKWNFAVIEVIRLMKWHILKKSKFLLQKNSSVQRDYFAVFHFLIANDLLKCFIGVHCSTENLKTNQRSVVISDKVQMSDSSFYPKVVKIVKSQGISQDYLSKTPGISYILNMKFVFNIHAVFIIHWIHLVLLSPTKVVAYISSHTPFRGEKTVWDIAGV